MSILYIELFKFLFIASFSLGAWTCINLMINKRGDRYIRRALIFYVFVLMIIPVNAYINLLHSEAFHFLTLLSQKLSLLYGPLLMILVDRLLLKNTNFKYLCWHFLPFFLVILDQACRWDWLTPWQYISILYLQIFFYLAYAINSIVQHKKRFQKLNENFRNSSYYWAMHLAFGLMVAMLWDLAIVSGLVFGMINSLSFTTVSASIFAIYISVLSLLFIYQPHISLKSESESPSETLIQTPQLRSIELSREAASELQQRLESLIQTHQPHLDEDISLAKLASLLGITTHQLSELLNIHMSISFYDYLNNLRYEESIKLLQDSNQEFSITDIAYRSGFNNRNSFYKIFKQKTGLTPTQFKKCPFGISVTKP
jgi:AraC-like DNA-binding protein